MLENEEKRFVIKEAQSLGWGGGTAKILLDMATGVNYLLITGSAGHAITPLLDENGKVITDK